MGVSSLRSGNRSNKLRAHVNFNGDISLMTYGRVLRRLAQKAGINDMVNVHRKGEDIICQKYKCLTSSAAIYTYNAKLSKVNFENDGSLFDISVDCRVNLPFENWGSVDISAIVLEALEAAIIFLSSKSIFIYKLPK